jgi:hypothetical protein
VINHYLGKNRPKLQEKLQQKSGLIDGELPASRRFCCLAVRQKSLFLQETSKDPGGLIREETFAGLARLCMLLTQVISASYDR